MRVLEEATNSANSHHEWLSARETGKDDSVDRYTLGVTLERHQHRWRIEEAHGPQSAGVCDCGAIKEFRNSVVDRDPLTRLQTLRVRRS